MTHPGFYDYDPEPASTLDLIAEQLDGMEAWMAAQVREHAQRRRVAWRSVAPDAWRGALKQLLGCAEPLGGDETRQTRAAAGDGWVIDAVESRSSSGFPASGLIGLPADSGAPAVLALPPSHVTPEDWFGLTGRLPAAQQLAGLLLRSGWRVVCPRPFAPLPIVNLMSDYPSFGAPPNGRDEVWRLATQAGLSLAGLEAQAGLACLAALEPISSFHLVGLGDSGRLALMLAAADERCRGASVADAFGDRVDPRAAFPWPELVHGWALRFGDAELTALISPRPVSLVDRFSHLSSAGYRSELTACEALGGARPRLLAAEHAAETAEQIMVSMNALAGIDASGAGSTSSVTTSRAPGVAAQAQAQAGAEARSQDRHERTCRRLRHLLQAAAQQRERRSFEDLAARRAEWSALVGIYPDPDAPLAVSGRLAPADFQADGLTVHEVCLPAYRQPAVFVRGLLAVPKDLAPGERRAAVICSHGWAGTPEAAHQPGIYNAFARRLAERGFVTWAPQSYFRSEFTVQCLYRMAALIGRTEFGLMAKLHQRAIDYLCSLPFVDPGRIGFYGLSYGGYTALWLNGLEPRLAAVVCAGHFNDWQPKTTGRNAASYLNTENASMYVPGILTRFNHGDLAALACPRPFLIEAGDQDQVARREWIEREFARARMVYALHGAADRIELAWGHGGHQVFGDRSFEFLEQWLKDEG